MLVEIRDTAQRALSIICNLANQGPDSKCFKERHCKVLRTIGINEQFWTEFIRF